MTATLKNLRSHHHRHLLHLHLRDQTVEPCCLHHHLLLLWHLRNQKLEPCCLHCHCLHLGSLCMPQLWQLLRHVLLRAKLVANLKHLSSHCHHLLHHHLLLRLLGETVKPCCPLHHLLHRGSLCILQLLKLMRHALHLTIFHPHHHLLLLLAHQMHQKKTEITLLLPRCLI